MMTTSGSVTITGKTYKISDRDRERFEREYADAAAVAVEDVSAARLLSGSYAVPKIATAFRWWLRGRYSVVVQLPEDFEDDCGFRSMNTIAVERAVLAAGANYSRT